MTTETASFARGRAWIAESPSTPNPGYWIENGTATVFATRADDNEIRVGVHVGESDTDDATVYLTDAEALRLVCLIGQAVLS